jgi:hypothetical protein
MPWWSTSAVAGAGGGFNIWIYGYGLRHNMIRLADYITADETPLYQTILAWASIVFIAVVSIISTWLKGLKGRLLLGGAGLVFVAYTMAGMFIIIAGRLKEYNIDIQGISSSGMFRQVNIVFDSSIAMGFYLSLVSGGLLLVLSLLRRIISGKY